MQLSSEAIATIRELVMEVQDETKPIEQRRAALKHIAALKGEPYPSTPDEDLSFVAGAIRPMPGFGIELFERGLSIASAADAVAAGRAARGMDQRRR